MKLLRLKINDPKGFRSLRQGFEVHFLREWDYAEAREFNPYVLAGPNGSGKSNILEALAAIFFHMESIHLRYRPNNFRYDEEENPGGFREEVGTPDAFELEYFIPVPDSLRSETDQNIAHICIVKELGQRPAIYWLNQSGITNNTKALDKKTAKEVLPAYILAYSSGENEILSLPFFKMRFIHFDEYSDFLIRDDFYGQAPEGRLIYLDEQFSQAILLSNLLLQPEEVLQPFEKELGLKTVKEFRLIIGKHQYETIHDDVFEAMAESDKVDLGKTRRELTSKLRTTIERLESCSTAQYTVYDDEGVEKFRVLDFFVDEATKEAFRYHFQNTPLNLFKAFQILHTLNYYTIDQATRAHIYKSKNIYLKQEMAAIALGERSIFQVKDFKLDKDGVEDVIYTKSLSDGEHQFIHSLGLCLLYKDENCLFLLDEPETHFNPDWRAKFISRLRDCFSEGKSGETIREMLITTHSPFLISDSRQEYVLLFDKNKALNSVSVRRPDFNTLGASINKITMEAFEKGSTIGGYAEQILNKFKKRLSDGEAADKIIDEANRTLGDSIEKILFINELVNRRRDK
ncbi:restriction system-associated AAA family ATPase [Desulforamulus ruminis]|uniref:restriction system-associated AAA family ATPase n=1 Tax=Desulforamulus ruminis TaxID=1564 RepID=UPI002FD9A25C